MRPWSWPLPEKMRLPAAAGEGLHADFGSWRALHARRRPLAAPGPRQEAAPSSGKWYDATEHLMSFEERKKHLQADLNEAESTESRG